MKKIIVANWKMNPESLIKAKSLFNSVKKGLSNLNKAEVVICPPFVYLSELNKLRKKSKIFIGAQNCFWEEKGAYTGEISASMIKSFCKHVILGHSERRKYFNETNEQIREKLKKALDSGLIPILCIGETDKERKQGKTKQVLKKQIQESLKKISKKNISKIIIAYEPVWAIGTGNACSVKQSFKAREFISSLFSSKVKILYGGSANSNNSLDYLYEAEFDGLLVGGASLSSKEFLGIIKKL